MNKSSFVISASLALTATHAMASVQEKVVELPGAPSVSPEVSAQIERAVSKSHVREAVNQIFNTLSRNFSENGVAISDKYFNDPELRDHMHLAAAGEEDSTMSYSSCYSNCYSACHSACHGSRGWR